jgi:S1-C subfamily serine protease
MKVRFLATYATVVLMCVSAAAWAAPAATQPATQPATKARFGMVVDDLNHHPNGAGAAKALGGNLYVNGILKGSRAERTGLRLRDVLLRIDGKEVHAIQDVLDAVHTPGLKDFDILRDKQPITLKEPPEVM